MDISREMIEKKAYELYLARGCQDGSDVSDWLEAERLLRAEIVPEKKPTRSAAPPTSRKLSANKTARRQ